MYIEKRDLYDFITQTNLEEIADKDIYINNAMSAAQQEIISYLANIYDTDTIFILDGDIADFGISVAYVADDRIIWEVDEYDTGEIYDTDEYTSYDDGTHTYIYKSKEDGVTGAWDGTKWTKLSENGSFFYNILAGTGDYPDNTDHWTKGNSQNAKLREVFADITIYNLHARVNPVQIPELRLDRRDNAVNWLKQLNKSLKNGGIKASLPLWETLTDAEQREKMEYGSNTKCSWR